MKGGNIMASKLSCGTWEELLELVTNPGKFKAETLREKEAELLREKEINGTESSSSVVAPVKVQPAYVEEAGS
jgi:hypothetical protein